MPHNYNFEKIDNIRTIEINPKGWISPITIEYGVSQVNEFDTMASICWRIKGTKHTWTIYENQLNEISKGNISEHFTQVLEFFRSQILDWQVDPRYKECDWVREYWDQYNRYIIT